MADLEEQDVDAVGAAPAEASAQPAGVPEDTGPVSLKEYVTEVPPYPEERANRIKFFYKKRERQPGRLPILIAATSKSSPKPAQWKRRFH